MQPLVISMSGLASFMRCRRQYLYLYEMLLDPKRTNDAAANGTSFHEMMAQAATGEAINEDAPMAAVALAYLQHRPLPTDILFAEQPIYTPLLPEVVLRCTFDLAYRKGDWTYVRDYKTFKAASEHDVDLDFQGKLYTAVARKHFATPDVMFEYEYVRQTPPDVPKDKAGKCWSVDECYETVQMYVPDHELDELWGEAQDVARDLLRAKDEGRFYRQPIKGTFNGCGGCFAKDLCKADLAQGGLDDQTIELLANKREPITLPKEKE